MTFYPIGHLDAYIPDPDFDPAAEDEAIPEHIDEDEPDDADTEVR